MKLFIIFIFLTSVANANIYWGANKSTFFKHKAKCEEFNGGTCFVKTDTCKKTFCDYTPAGFTIDLAKKATYDEKVNNRTQALSAKALSEIKIKTWDCSLKQGDMKIICRYLKGLEWGRTKN